MAGAVRARVIAVTLAAAFSLVGCVEGLQSGTAKSGEAQADALHNQAQSGDSDSQYELGIRYASGMGVAQDHGEAITWFRRAADQGHAEAAYMLGVSYAAGRAGDVDEIQALKWYETAAEAGHVRALYQVGDAYLNGRGVTKEPAWGLRWLERAALAGHGEAQFATGVAFAAGLGTDKNPSEGLAWLQIARKTGRADVVPVIRAVKGREGPDVIAKAKKLSAAFEITPPQTGLKDRPTARFVQYALTRLGQDAGGADGKLGPKTRRAIANFRKQRQLEGRGVDAALIDVLRTLLSVYGG